ncbi:hypothetical protein Tco_1237893 [Tanacetum coccineum]
MMTMRKRVRPLPTHRLAVRHSVDYSSSDHFSSDDSSRDSSLSSSSESSLNSFADALSNSASSCSYFDHSSPTPSLAYEPIQHFMFILPRIKAIDREEIKTGMRGPVEVRVDRDTHPVFIEFRLLRLSRGSGTHTVATGTAACLICWREEPSSGRYNMRLRDMMDVASQRVARSQRRELRVQREMRQIRCFRFYDRMRIVRGLRLKPRGHLGLSTMPNTRSGVSRTREGINEQIDRQMVGALGARTTARNFEPLMRERGCPIGSK